MGYLKYDSLNIITNMFSIHVFIVLLLLQILFLLLLQLQCCQVATARCKVCKFFGRAAQGAMACDLFTIGILRIMSTGFLEILISTYVGLGLFWLDEMTFVDQLTSIINILYAIGLLAFLGVIFWFICYKVQPLVKFKAERDHLEHLKILRLINERMEGPEAAKSMRQS